MKLSVIVPVYNEEKCLTKNVKIFCEYLNYQNFEYELIIVNDGSKDKTKELAENISQTTLKVKTVSYDQNKGKGFAIRQGMKISVGDYCLFLDADNATTIDHLDLVWGKINSGFEVIIGSRNINDNKEAKVEIAQPIWKILLGRGGNFLVRKIMDLEIHDSQCGFKVFSKKYVMNIFPKCRIDRWAIDIELLLLAKKYGYKIGIIPVKWRNSSDSRVGVMGYINTLREVFKIKYNLKKGKYN